MPRVVRRGVEIEGVDPQQPNAAGDYPAQRF